MLFIRADQGEGGTGRRCWEYPDVIPSYTKENYYEFEENAGVMILGNDIAWGWAGRRYSLKRFSLLFVVSCLSCKPSSELPAPPPVGADATPVGLPLSGFRGMTRATQALDRLREANSSMFEVRVRWADIEPVPGSVNLNTLPFESLDVIAEIYPELLGTFVISIMMISVSVRTMPPDLMELPFNHPVVLSRMDGVIDVLAAHSLAGAIDCILLGEESDTYLAAHPDEVGAFTQFLEHATNRIRQKLPQAKVATTITFNGVRTILTSRLR